MKKLTFALVFMLVTNLGAQTPQFRIQWTQPPTSSGDPTTVTLGNAQAANFIVRYDSSAVGSILQGVTCSIVLQSVVCIVGVNSSLTVGAHSLTLASANIAGENPIPSQPVVFGIDAAGKLVLVPATPTGVRVIP